MVAGARSAPGWASARPRCCAACRAPCGHRQRAAAREHLGQIAFRDRRQFTSPRADRPHRGMRARAQRPGGIFEVVPHRRVAVAEQLPGDVGTDRNNEPASDNEDRARDHCQPPPHPTSLPHALFRQGYSEREEVGPFDSARAMSSVDITRIAPSVVAVLSRPQQMRPRRRARPRQRVRLRDEDRGRVRSHQQQKLLLRDHGVATRINGPLPAFGADRPTRRRRSRSVAACSGTCNFRRGTPGAFHAARVSLSFCTGRRILRSWCHNRGATGTVRRIRGGDREMRRRAWIAWSALVGTGLVIIALPDDDVRLFSISGRHGPSAVDTIGIMFILVAWVVVLVVIWRGRQRLPRGRVWHILGWSSVVVGTAITAWSVLGDHGSWWVLGVALLAGLQVTAAATVRAPVTRKRARPSAWPSPMKDASRRHPGRGGPFDVQTPRWRALPRPAADEKGCRPAAGGSGRWSASPGRR